MFVRQSREGSPTGGPDVGVNPYDISSTDNRQGAERPVPKYNNSCTVRLDRMGCKPCRGLQVYRAPDVAGRATETCTGLLTRRLQWTT